MSTLEKRIHFFDISFFGERSDGTEYEISVESVFAHIGQLPIAAPSDDETSRYWPLPGNGEDSLLMEVSKHAKFGTIGIFAVKRRSGIPRIERGGAYRNVNLGKEDGLAEIRHFVCWPKLRIIGFEINGRGPTMSRLESYILAKAGSVGVKAVRIQIRLASDQFDLLDNTRRISSASVEVARDRLSEVSKLDTDLQTGLSSLANSTNAKTVRFEWKLGDRSPESSLELKWLPKIRGFLNSPNHRGTIEKMKVNAFDSGLGKMRTLDLLENEFVGYRSVVQLRSGVVDQEAMLKAIVAVRKDLPERPPGP